MTEPAEKTRYLIECSGADERGRLRPRCHMHVSAESPAPVVEESPVPTPVEETAPTGPLAASKPVCLGMRCVLILIGPCNTRGLAAEASV